MNRVRISLAQINPVVGDLENNARKIISFIARARLQNSGLVVFPELSLSGYPPEDLLLKEHFISDNQKYIRQIARSCGQICAVVGFPYVEQGKLFNAAAFIRNGKVARIYKKIFLPNYGVFDEQRYFTSGSEATVIALKEGFKVGVNICEDIWHENGPQRAQVLEGNARMIINISASPYHMGKINERARILRMRARENKSFVLYCNLVGGQDELVFDGASMVFGPRGELLAQARQFEEELLNVEFDLEGSGGFSNTKEKALGALEEVYAALTLGLKDYVRKNGFKKVVLGLSGGIDSALSAVLAVDALGAENVVALTMPSQYSSSGTRSDAKKIAVRLGIELKTIPIDDIYRQYLKGLSRFLKSKSSGITEQNIQARIRGNLLMAFSNKFGMLVLTTGNKSEISTGYCTLYGDMAGGFSVLKDVPKGLVYRLSAYRNSLGKEKVIPASVIKRAPSAELRPNQKDQDTLPPYQVLDKIIDLYIENDLGAEQIIKKGFSESLVKKVIAMIDANEYKRRQASPGVKITPKAFGKDRRMPITNRYIEKIS